MTKNAFFLSFSALATGASLLSAGFGAAEFVGAALLFFGASGIMGSTIYLFVTE